MQLKDRLIIEDYRKNKEDFVRLGELVHGILEDIAKKTQIHPMLIQHRVKQEESLIGKLHKDGDWYKSFDDLMDILGARVILYFADEVDIFGKHLEDVFQIDPMYSANKADLLDSDTFGYLSVHYICTLREDRNYPKELCGKKFEIQMRTCLQHIWADINHDIAYKSRFGVPREIKRGFSRLAGLLELADNEFMRVRDSMNSYSAEIHERIVNNQADDVHINMLSLGEYMLYNCEIQRFLKALALIEGSEITAVSPEGYIEQLAYLGITTLGGLQNMLLENGELAYHLAKESLSGSELDILSSNVALRFLCRAYMLQNAYSKEQMTKFFLISYGDASRAEQQAKRLISMRTR